MKPKKELVAQRLKLLKSKSRMTVEAFAEKVGAHKSNINTYMRGVALPPQDVVNRIAKFSGVYPDWIYYGDLKEYIKDLLTEMNYINILKYYPETIGILEDKYLEYIKVADIKGYNFEVLLKLFKTYNRDLLQQKVSNLLDNIDIKDKMEGVPLYGLDVDEDENWNYFVKDLIINIEKDLKERWFESQEEILVKINNAVNDYKRWSITKDPNLLKFVYEESYKRDFLDFCVTELEDDIGIANFIHQYVFLKGLDYSFDSKESKDILEAFKELGKKMKDIKQKHYPE